MFGGRSPAAGVPLVLPPRERFLKPTRASCSRRAAELLKFIPLCKLQYPPFFLPPFRNNKPLAILVIFKSVPQAPSLPNRHTQTTLEGHLIHFFLKFLTKSFIGKQPRWRMEFSVYFVERISLKQENRYRDVSFIKTCLETYLHDCVCRTGGWICLIYALKLKCY